MKLQMSYGRSHQTSINHEIISKAAGDEQGVRTGTQKSVGAGHGCIIITSIACHCLLPAQACHEEPITNLILTYFEIYQLLFYFITFTCLLNTLNVFFIYISKVPFYYFNRLFLFIQLKLTIKSKKAI